MTMAFVLPPATGKFIHAGGLALHYIEDGPSTAPPLLLIHGLLASTDAYEKVRSKLADKYHLFILDLPGHGYSDKRDDFSMTLEDQAATVAAFMEAVGLNTCSVAGQSMGGGISLVFAARYPQKVDKLIVIDSICYPFKMPFKGRLATIPLLGWLLVNKVYNRKIMEAFIKDDVYFDGSQAADHEIDMMYAHFNTPAARRAAFRALKHLADPSFLGAEIKKIRAKTLIIWGAEDQINPVALADRLAADISGSQKLVIERCGHLPMNEAPEAFCNGVLAFLGETK